ARGYPIAVASLPDKLDAIAAAVAVFSETGVAYALIGGLAVGIRSGIPRATLDVDFAIPTTVDRAHLTQSLGGRGFRLMGEFAGVRPLSQRRPRPRRRGRRHRR